MLNRCLLLLILLWAVPASSFDAQPRRAVDISGHWVLNTALSEDPWAMLLQRQAREDARYQRMRDRAVRQRPADELPPIEAPQRPQQRPWQQRQEENHRRMLAISDYLRIEQDGRELRLTSEVESRRLLAGTRSQVSMPESQLADAQAGWKSDAFVIRRRTRGGPRVEERLRLLPTGQLEYQMQWSGDTELAGIKARRVFDRGRPAPATASPSGPRF